MKFTFPLALGMACCLLCAATQPDLEGLWQANRWFELRDAAQNAAAPEFYRGAAASAFGANEDAVKYLTRAFENDSSAMHKIAAAGYLAAVYDRLGHYHDAFDWHGRMADAAAQAKMPMAQSQSQALLKSFSALPDEQVTERGYSRSACSKDRSVVAIAVEVDGHAGCYSLDTNAAFSSMGEAEAKRIGLEMQAGGVELNGMPVRIGLAHELRAGQFRIRNVAFVVFPGVSPVLEAEPAILGVPVVVAFDSLSWSADGAVELGLPAGKSDAAPNLYFNWVLPVIGVDVVGRRVSLQLDTGSDHTFLWPEFARAFPGVTALAGKIDIYEQMGLFGNTIVQFWPVPELQVAIGGSPLTLRQVKLLAASAQKNCQWCLGTLGMDVSGAAGAATIDFRAMFMTLTAAPR